MLTVGRDTLAAPPPIRAVNRESRRYADTFIRNKSNLSLKELCEALTRVTGQCQARHDGDINYPKLNERKAARAAREALHEARAAMKADGLEQVEFQKRLHYSRRCSR
eukprot:1276015-Prymnesium_polylepis.1